MKAYAPFCSGSKTYRGTFSWKMREENQVPGFRWQPFFQECSFQAVQVSRNSMCRKDTSKYQGIHQRGKLWGAFSRSRNGTQFCRLMWTLITVFLGYITNPYSFWSQYTRSERTIVLKKNKEGQEKNPALQRNSCVLPEILQRSATYSNACWWLTQLHGWGWHRQSASP